MLSAKAYRAVKSKTVANFDVDGFNDTRVGGNIGTCSRSIARTSMD